MPLPLKPPKAAPPELFISRVRSQRQTFPSIASIIALTRPPPSFHVRWLPFCAVDNVDHGVGRVATQPTCTGALRRIRPDSKMSRCMATKTPSVAPRHALVPRSDSFDIDVVAPAEPAAADDLVRYEH